MNMQRGFTLIELAIVMVILTVLAGGLLMPLTKRIEIKRYENSKEILEEAREALIGYAMSHRATDGTPYLPCPDTNGDGIEEIRDNGNCPAVSGNLPWVTLGLVGIDAWGNRLTYRASSNFINSKVGFSSFPPSLGDNRICSAANAAGCAGDMLANQVPAVLLSHGNNGLGALNANNTAQSPPVSIHETENNDGDPDFVSHAPGGEGANEFDDLVVWLPLTTLFSRVCSTGCTATTSTSATTTTTTTTTT